MTTILLFYALTVCIGLLIMMRTISYCIRKPVIEFDKRDWGVVLTFSFLPPILLFVLTLQIADWVENHNFTWPTAVKIFFLKER